VGGGLEGGRVRFLSGTVGRCLGASGSTALRLAVDGRFAAGFVGGGIDARLRESGAGLSLCVGSSERFFPTVPLTSGH
jgi:hypothetical protein